MLLYWRQMRTCVITAHLPSRKSNTSTALWFGSDDPLSLFVQKEMASDEETKTNDETQTRLF